MYPIPPKTFMECRRLVYVTIWFIIDAIVSTYVYNFANMFYSQSAISFRMQFLKSHKL